MGIQLKEIQGRKRKFDSNGGKQVLDLVALRQWQKKKLSSLNIELTTTLESYR